MHNRDQGSTECAKLRMNTLQKLRFGTKESRRKVANWPCGIEYPCENPRGAREWTKFKGISGSRQGDFGVRPSGTKPTGARLLSTYLSRQPPALSRLVRSNLEFPPWAV